MKTAESRSVEYVILGAGGFAREVKQVLERNSIGGISYTVIGFASDDKKQWKKELNQCPVVGTIEDIKTLEPPLGSYFNDGPTVICGVGDPKLKRVFVKRAEEQNLKFIHYVMHENVGYEWEEYNSIGDGTVICSHTSITCNVCIGEHVAINLNCTIGHDVVIEDYCNISPGVNISGYVHIEEGVDIGTGVAILPKIRIGKGSIIGAGSVIIKDVPSYSVVVGVPGKVIKTIESI